jgi:mRNA interferase YafQ
MISLTRRIILNGFQGRLSKKVGNRRKDFPKFVIPTGTQGEFPQRNGKPVPVRSHAIVTTSQFEKDVKLARKRRKDTKKLEEVVGLLADHQPLPPRLRDLALSGEWSHYRDCHIEPNWILIYRVNKEAEESQLVRTGTHADLF